MGIEYRKNLAVFTGLVTADDAETLLEWLTENPKSKVDLAACSHLHTANMQVLLAAKPVIKARPDDESLTAWLDTLLRPN